MQTLRRWAKQLKRDTYAVYLCCRDSRVPWYAKVLASCVVAYALSPIDLIPDFIPILGYLDDLVLVPLGLMLAIRLIPTAVLQECRTAATQKYAQEQPKSWIAALVIVSIWVGLGLVFTVWLTHLLPRR